MQRQVTGIGLMDPGIVQRETDSIFDGTDQQITAHAHHGDESQDQPYRPVRPPGYEEGLMKRIWLSPMAPRVVNSG